MGIIPSLQRVEFFSGELLTADDLTTLGTNNQQLRWLHNRTMHNWGIAFGLDVQGTRGATSVTVNPGIAVDALGREIILSSPVQQSIPAVPGGANGTAAAYYLVTNFVPDTDEAVVEQRSATACGKGGSVRLSNAPAILWKTNAQLENGIDIILGQVSIQNCVLNETVSGAARRNAVNGGGGSITAAALSAADVQWSPMNSTGVNSGFTASIDTSAANFQATPLYVAQVIGSRILSSPAGMIVDFVSVASPTVTGFVLQLALPALGAGVNPTTISDPQTGPKLMSELGWQISWVAVEG